MKFAVATLLFSPLRRAPQRAAPQLNATFNPTECLKMLQATAENSVDVAALVNLLRGVPIGATISYAEIERALGRPILPRRYLLHRATDILNKEAGAVFGNVRGVGYKRLEIDDVPGIGATARRAISKKAARASKYMSRAISRANDVPAHVALETNRELSVLGLIRSAASAKVSKEVAKGVTPESPMPIAKVAERLIAALS